MAQETGTPAREREQPEQPASGPGLEPRGTAKDDARKPGNAAAERPRSQPARSWFRSHPAALLAAFVVLAILGVAGFFFWTYLASYESTDDAQVDAHIYPVSPRIQGRVTAVAADINQRVAQGQPLIQLDPTDYQVMAQRAQADLEQQQANAQAAATQIPMTATSTSSQLSTAQAGVLEAQAGIAVAEQQFEAAQARVREAQANYIKAQKDVDRYRPLAAKQEISQQQFDQAVAAANALSATVDTAKANSDAAARQVSQMRARLAQAQAQVSATRSAPQEMAGMRARAGSAQAAAAKARADLEQARLAVQYTAIQAPVAGVVGKRNVEVGQQVQPGQELLSVVPLNDLWVTANFKETQLRHMRVGQKASIHVDAADRSFNGRVDSFPGATGSRFSLLPPENATGNYVKVVQRLPVKIVFDPNQDTAMLRPGMSVEAKVSVK